MNKHFVITCLFLYSSVIYASDGQDLLKEVMSDFEYKNLHQKWSIIFNTITGLQKAQHVAQQQLKQPNPQVYSCRRHIDGCCEERNNILQTKQQELNEINLQLSGVILRVMMRHAQSTPVVDSVTSDTKKVSSISSLTKPSYAQVLGVCRTMPSSNHFHSLSDNSSVSDLTTSESIVSVTISNVGQIKATAKCNVTLGFDPQIGITSLQAVSRGWLVRKNLSALQRYLAYKKAKEMESKKQETSSSVTSLLVLHRGKGVKAKTQITKKSEVEEERLLELAIDQNKRERFFVEHPGILDLIERHAKKLAEQALPETKKCYSDYKKNKSVIAQYVITPWTQSWMHQLELKQTGLSEAEKRYCQQEFELNFRKKIVIGYKKS